jgi:hypothetical protein
MCVAGKFAVLKQAECALCAAGHFAAAGQSACLVRGDGLGRRGGLDVKSWV